MHHKSGDKAGTGAQKKEEKGKGENKSRGLSDLAGGRSASIFAGFGSSPTIAVSRELYLTSTRTTRNKHK